MKQLTGLISKLYKQLMQLNAFIFKVCVCVCVCVCVSKQYVAWSFLVVVVIAAVFCHYYKLFLSMSTFRPFIFKVVIDVVGLLSTIFVTILDLCSLFLFLSFILSFCHFNFNQAFCIISFSLLSQHISYTLKTFLVIALEFVIYISS